jgi:predicted RecB family endonuclease
MLPYRSAEQVHDALGVKVVTVMPDAIAARTVQALYLLLDRHTGAATLVCGA